MPENLNGRWIIEDQWEGDECVWYNPFNEPSNLTELTFQTPKPRPIGKRMAERGSCR